MGIIMPFSPCKKQKTNAKKKKMVSSPRCFARALAVTQSVFFVLNLHDKATDQRALHLLVSLVTIHDGKHSKVHGGGEKKKKRE